MSVENETTTSPLRETEWTLVPANDNATIPYSEICNLVARYWYVDDYSRDLSSAQQRAVIEHMQGDFRLVNRHGKISKRLNDAWHKASGSDMPPDTRDRLAIMVDQYTDKSLYARLQRKLNWRAGEYGESSNSCYFTYHKSARAILTMAGTYALLLRKESTDLAGGTTMSNGIGRSFLVPYQGRVYMRNSYGVARERQLRALAFLLGKEEIPATRHDFHVATRVDNDKFVRAYLNGDSSYDLDLGADTSGPPHNSVLMANPCYCIRYWQHLPRGDSKQCSHCPFSTTDGQPYPSIYANEDSGFERYPMNDYNELCENDDYYEEENE